MSNQTRHTTSDIEKRARELLAAEYRRGGLHTAASRIIDGNELGGDFRALRAIIVALSAAPQDSFKASHDEWMDKTEWVQKSATVAELGMHRADVLRMRIEALQAAAPQVPEGWVLVPVEPTEAMLDILSGMKERSPDSELRDAYWEILTASPGLQA